MPAGRRDALARALDAVLGMDYPEIEFGARVETQLIERLEESVVVALDRNRHVEKRQRMRDRLGDRVGELDHLAGITRLDEMLGFEIAVAQVDAEFDIVPERGAEMRCIRATKSAFDTSLRFVRPRQSWPSQNTISMQTSHWIESLSCGISAHSDAISSAIARS